MAKGSAQANGTRPKWPETVESALQAGCAGTLNQVQVQMRFTIDSMIFDRLVENDELITLVTRLVDEGRIELV